VQVDLVLPDVVGRSGRFAGAVGGGVARRRGQGRREGEGEEAGQGRGASAGAGTGASYAKSHEISLWEVGLFRATYVVRVAHIVLLMA
jgi:hypothetical protein